MDLFSRPAAEKMARRWKRGAQKAWDRSTDEEMWSDVRARALGTWSAVREEAEKRFQDSLQRAEQSWKNGSLHRLDIAARRPSAALALVGAALGALLVLMLLSDREEA